MIDLHCHILPKVDDGASSMDEALAMARLFVKDGITHVIATPHCHRYVHWLRADILPRAEEFNGQLESLGIALRIFPGSEIQVTDRAEYRREFEAGLYCHLGGGREFTLLEFNWARDLFPQDAAELVDWIHQQGMTPIIAHPERHDYLMREPALLQDVVDAGAWVQVTVDSLLGNHGPDPQDAAQRVLQNFPEAVLATDSHNLRRCSGLSAGYKWVRDNMDDARADDLLARSQRVLESMQRGAASEALAR